MKRAPRRRTGRSASSPAFAPTRSFWPGWAATLKPFQNLLEHDNVLCFLVDFDTKRVLDPAQGSLFGVIAETTPAPQGQAFVGHPPVRFDWVGRPEQTNVRLNNPGVRGRRSARPVEPADAVRHRAGIRADFPQAPARQPAQLRHARRQGRLVARPARRERECVSRRLPAHRRRQADIGYELSRDREEHAQRASLSDRRRQDAQRARHRHALYVDRQSRPRAARRGRHACDAARPQHVPLSRAAEHRVADRGRIDRRRRRRPTRYGR